MPRLSLPISHIAVVIRLSQRHHLQLGPIQSKLIDIHHRTASYRSLLVSLHENRAGRRVEDIMWSASFEPWIAQFVIDVPAVGFQREPHAVRGQIAVDPHGIGLSKRQNLVRSQRIAKVEFQCFAHVRCRNRSQLGNWTCASPAWNRFSIHNYSCLKELTTGKPFANLMERRDPFLSEFDGATRFAPLIFFLQENSIFLKASFLCLVVDFNCYRPLL